MQTPMPQTTADEPGGERPTLLVINTGNLKKRFIFQTLKKLPVKVVLVNAEKNWAGHYVDDWILVDTNNHDRVIEKIGRYRRQHPIDGVITFWEDDVLLTSKLVDKFGLIGIPWSVARQARNKLNFRRFCQDNGLPVPRFFKVKDESDIPHAIEQLQFPVVIKPIFGSSSAYVMKVEAPSELLSAYRYIHRNLSTQVESALAEGSGIMVEEYIDGDEVDVDLLIQNGKVKFWSISDNFQTQEPFFVEKGFSIPTILPEQAQTELVNLAEEVIEKLGIMHACIHFEAKYTKTGPVPIEINLRLGGDEVYEFVKQAWHVDLIENAVKIATGQYLSKITKPEEPFTYLVSENFLPEKSGVISSIEVPEKFDKEDGVKQLNFYKEVGDTVLAPPAGYEYLGWVSVAGDNHNDARDKLAEVLEEISFEVVPFSGVSAIGKTERKSPISSASIQANLARGQARIAKVRHAEQRNLTIGVACNTYSNDQGSVEAELTAVGRTIEQTLQEQGYQTVFIDFNDLSRAVEILKNGQVDLVFNVGERLNNSSLLEPHIAALFDMFQIPYTGSNPFTLSLCIDKIRVKKLLTYHNIPTAKWDYAYDLSDAIRDDLTYPLIVKPANTDNSIGVTQDSVVTNEQELKTQLEYVLTQLKRPALVEEYLDGDEYDVGIMGSEPEDLKVLPLTRTIFDNLPENRWNIYDFDSKFSNPDAFKKYITEQRPPKNVNKKLLALITEIALDTYNILDAHDYGRVEIKLDKNDNPHVLELNPNPSINKGNALPEMAALIGLDYGDFLEEIIALAIKRYQNKPPYYHLQAGLY